MADPIQMDVKKLCLRPTGINGGVYGRVADKLGLDASYVSRVAIGKKDAKVE